MIFLEKTHGARVEYFHNPQGKFLKYAGNCTLERRHISYIS